MLSLPSVTPAGPLAVNGCVRVMPSLLVSHDGLPVSGYGCKIVVSLAGFPLAVNGCERVIFALPVSHADLTVSGERMRESDALAPGQSR